MFNGQNIRREVIILLIGAAIGVLFGVLVAYPEMLANTRENAARIESNEKQIERLWEAHEISHSPPEVGTGQEQ
jgi:hypothetical protein